MNNAVMIYDSGYILSGDFHSHLSEVTSFICHIEHSAIYDSLTYMDINVYCTRCGLYKQIHDYLDESST
jgi:hypothetical protein